MDPTVTFTLDQYEPVAFHTYPALMRAAEARTELLRPPEPVASPTALVRVAASPIQGGRWSGRLPSPGTGEDPC